MVCLQLCMTDHNYLNNQFKQLNCTTSSLPAIHVDALLHSSAMPWAYSLDYLLRLSHCLGGNEKAKPVDLEHGY